MGRRWPGAKQPRQPRRARWTLPGGSRYRAQARRRVAQTATTTGGGAGRGYVGRLRRKQGLGKSIAVWLPPARRSAGPRARWNGGRPGRAVRHDHGYQRCLTPVDRGLVTECRATAATAAEARMTLMTALLFVGAVQSYAARGAVESPAGSGAIHGPGRTGSVRTSGDIT